MQSMQRRLAAINPEFQVSEVVAQDHQNPYPGALVNALAVGSSVFTFGKNQSRDQTPATNTSRPLVFNVKTGENHHGDLP